MYFLCNVLDFLHIIYTCTNICVIAINKHVAAECSTQVRRKFDGNINTLINKSCNMLGKKEYTYNDVYYMIDDRVFEYAFLLSKYRVVHNTLLMFDGVKTIVE